MPISAKTLLNEHQRHKEIYLTLFPGCHYTGDEAVRHEDGYYEVLEWVDDEFNVCGHCISASEIGNSLSSCRSISELAALGSFDEITGQKVCLDIVLIDKFE